MLKTKLLIAITKGMILAILFEYSSDVDPDPNLFDPWIRIQIFSLDPDYNFRIQGL